MSHLHVFKGEHLIFKTNERFGVFIVLDPQKVKGEIYSTSLSVLALVFEPSLKAESAVLGEKQNLKLFLKQLNRGSITKGSNPVH